MKYSNGIVQSLGLWTIVAVSLLQGADATVECYVCKPKLDVPEVLKSTLDSVMAKVTSEFSGVTIPECIESNVTESAKKMDCPQAESYCSKFDIPGGFYGRSCMKKSDSLEEGCKTAAGFETCLCDDDLCNATSNVTPTMAVIMAVSAVMAMVYKM